MTPTIGTRFTRTDSRPYTDTDGTKRTHGITTLCEVTAMNQTGLDYTVIKVIEETDRPAFATTATGGSLAAFGWQRAVNEGRIKVVG